MPGTALGIEKIASSTRPMRCHRGDALEINAGIRAGDGEASIGSEGAERAGAAVTRRGSSAMRTKPRQKSDELEVNVATACRATIPRC